MAERYRHDDDECPPFFLSFRMEEEKEEVANAGLYFLFFIFPYFLDDSSSRVEECGSATCLLTSAFSLGTKQWLRFGP